MVESRTLPPEEAGLLDLDDGRDGALPSDFSLLDEDEDTGEKYLERNC